MSKQQSQVKQEKSTELVPTDQERAMAEAGAYADYAGAGFENQTSEDLSIPFLTILQGLSPVLKERKDLRQGMVYNTVTGDAVESVSFIPVCTQHLFVEWKPRKQGGGFVGMHEPTEKLVVDAKAQSTEFGRFSTAYADGKPVGNDLIETFYVYGMNLSPEGGWVSCVLAFTSTGIKKYKGWMTKARSIQIALQDGRRIPAPLFAHRYTLSTVVESNEKGEWYNWNIGFSGDNAVASRVLPSDPVFQELLKLKSSIESGRARANVESQNQAAPEGGAEKAPF